MKGLNEISPSECSCFFQVWNSDGSGSLCALAASVEVSGLLSADRLRHRATGRDTALLDQASSLRNPTGKIYKYKDNPMNPSSGLNKN